jgi:hypothetical protein
VRQFLTPEKTPASTQLSPNRYSALEEEEEIEQKDLSLHMDEDVDEITTVQGSWDDDDNNQESNHPITLLQTQEYDSAEQHNRHIKKGYRKFEVA